MAGRYQPTLNSKTAGIVIAFIIRDVLGDDAEVKDTGFVRAILELQTSGVT